MNLKRMLASSIVALTLCGTLGVGLAGAAPTNAKDAFPLDITCGTHMYTVVTNGNGSFTPAQIIAGGSGTLIPVTFDLTGTDAEGNVVFSETSAHSGQMTGRQDNLVTCSADQTIPGVGRIFGTVTGILAPVGH
ncbi:MAG TPA: hypothetical protein VFI42_09425 [Thermomicrobiaceae bacterium]|nr:hypothetical protein [Thermomicrobiaceae bacterium]